MAERVAMSEITITEDEWGYVVEGPGIEPWLCEHQQDAEHYAGLHRRIHDLETENTVLRAERDRYRETLRRIATDDTVAMALDERLYDEPGPAQIVAKTVVKIATKTLEEEGSDE
jgi:hypothetical protein